VYYFNYYKNVFKTIAKAKFKKDDIKGIINSDYLNIGVLDPSIGTSNLGDYIILQSINDEISDIYPNDMITRYPSQLVTAYDAKSLMAANELIFVCGTNLLTSNMDKRNQWKMDPLHPLFIRNTAVLFGVGWWQYQEDPNRYTRKLYSNLLKEDCLHSVRDSYSLEMLNKAGIKNVVNTSCPTLWGLTPDACKKISTKKSDSVITTLTCYKKNPQQDKLLLDMLVNKYEKVYLWLQNLDDITYLNEFYDKIESLILVPPSLVAYDLILKNEDIDYIGTRLHAGIRALQKGRKTLIVAVDNRAVEIGKDVNLNVMKRDDLSEIGDVIESEYITEINLPWENINKWKNSLPQSKNKFIL
jgi:hypothetical protein